MSYFVTGTDTDVGKTLISCALLKGFAGRGLRVAGMKPVSCDVDGVSLDVVRLRAASNVLASRGQINPYCFEQAVAPHLAAKFAGVNISLARIVGSYRELVSQADMVIVEGTGGFCVPLNDDEDGADLAIQLKQAVILVVGMRLGCLNHALLTQLAIEASGLKLAGWVANCVESEMPMRNENIHALKLRIKAPLLGVVPHYPQLPDAQEVAACLDFDLLDC